jgi:hypothetical protein
MTGAGTTPEPWLWDTSMSLSQVKTTVSAAFPNSVPTIAMSSATTVTQFLNSRMTLLLKALKDAPTKLLSVSAHLSSEYVLSPFVSGGRLLEREGCGGARAAKGAGEFHRDD